LHNEFLIKAIYLLSPDYSTALAISGIASHLTWWLPGHPQKNAILNPTRLPWSSDFQPDYSTKAIPFHLKKDNKSKKNPKIYQSNFLATPFLNVIHFSICQWSSSFIVYNVRHQPGKVCFVNMFNKGINSKIYNQ